MDPFSFEFNTSLMHRKQIIHLALLFLLSIPFFILAILYLGKNFDESFLFFFWGGVVVVPWIISLIRYLMLRKSTIKFYEIHPDGVIRINEDLFDLKERTLYFVPGNGFMRIFWFFPRRICVKAENGKTIKTYYCGIAADSKTCSDVNNFLKCCHDHCETFKKILIDRNVHNEIYRKFDVVTVEIPRASIRREFYKLGSIPLGMGILGYVLSCLDLKKSGIPEVEIMLLRYLSIACIICGILLALVFYTKFRRAPGKIEVRKDCITIDGKVFDTERISNIRMSKKNSLLYRDDDDSWLLIRYDGTWIRYFLGQAKNSDCFEARRRLSSAIKILLSDEGEEERETDDQDETDDR